MAEQLSSLKHFSSVAQCVCPPVPHVGGGCRDDASVRLGRGAARPAGAGIPDPAGEDICVFSALTMRCRPKRFACQRFSRSVERLQAQWRETHSGSGKRRE